MEPFIIIVLCLMWYAFVYGQKYIKYTPPPKKLGLKYIDPFCNKLPAYSSIVFDQEDLINALEFIYKEIVALTISSEPYDILFELNISIDNTINFSILSAGILESQLNKLEDNLSKGLPDFIPHYPKFFDFHCILRYYNSDPLFPEEEIKKFKETVIENKFSFSVKNLNKKLKEFRLLKINEKFEYLSNFVNEIGLIRIRDFIVYWPDKSNSINWLIKKLFDIDYKDEIDIQKICSELKLWKSQIEISSLFPIIPLLIGSFYIHNKKYDIARYYFRVAGAFCAKQYWQSLYCIYSINFLSIIKKEEDIISENVTKLVEENKFADAEHILKDYLELNPFSAQANDELLFIEKLQNYSNWTPEREKKYRTNHKNLVLKECDPFYCSGNILYAGEEKINNDIKKKFAESKEIYDAYRYALQLNEPLMEATIAIILFVAEMDQKDIKNLLFFALSLSRVLNVNIRKIEKILNKYQQNI